MSCLAKQLIEKEKKEKTGYLDLGNCGLTEWPDLSELIRLKTLILSSKWYEFDLKTNEWVDFDSQNQGPKNSLQPSSNYLLPTGIIKLIANELGINDIRPLEKLKTMKFLDLCNSRITDIRPLERLTALQGLYLNNNQITDIQPLEKLTAMKFLDLGNNRITDICPLEKLTAMKFLDLGGNEIADIRPLEKLKALQSLELNDNLISDISKVDWTPMKQLIRLDISNTNVTDLTPALPLIKRGLKVKWDWSKAGICLEGCELIIPPRKIVEQGNAAILNYLRQLEEEQGKEDYLFETKLLIIGEAGAGKTTFARRLQQADAVMPGEGDSTHGINVDKWSFNVPAKYFEGLNHRAAKFNVNLWDFGGQEVYHGTHQFFFSKKSLYVLLCDTREQKTDFRYWLNTVEQLCGEDAHLIVLFNRREGHDWSLDAGFRERFKRLIKEEKRVDLSVVESIPALQELFQELLCCLPNVGQKLIQSWVDIRTDLAKETANDISFDRFQEICAAHGRTREDDLRAISRYFDDIGVFTHYIDDVVLRERVYLNSNHLVKTVYQLLDNEHIKSYGGRIGKAAIEAVWESLRFEKERLPRLLERFGLMYEVPSRSEYIIPEHLPDSAPYVKWSHEGSQPQLHFRYEFDKYMPKGLMSRLIVALHHSIPDHRLVWRRGLNLSLSTSLGAGKGEVAEITENLGGTNRFDIRIAGGLRQRDLLVMITWEFDNILGDFKNLSVSRELRCPCEECRTNIDPYFHKMRDIEQALIKKYQQENPTVECKLSYKDVLIIELLGLVDYKVVLKQVKIKWWAKDKDELHLFEKMEASLKRIENATERIEGSLGQVLILFKESHNSLLTELQNRKGPLFGPGIDEVAFFKKVEELLEKYKVKDAPKDWQDQSPNKKFEWALKLPLVIAEFKYKQEYDVSKLERPKTLKEFFGWFVKAE